MAKKIRFSLEMEQGIEVRSIEELRDNFSLARVLGYVSNGKMIIWLRDRYEDDIANAIEQLNLEDKELPKKISEIFDVPYDEDAAIDLEKAEERNRKLSILKEYTAEQKYFDVVDKVAFNQDDIYDLLDEGEEVIYLCGEKFSIPLSKKNMIYYGVNNPIVVVDSKKEVDWEEVKITLTGVKYDEKYQAVVDSAKKTKEKLYQKAVEEADAEKPIGEYLPNTYLSLMLSLNEKKESQIAYEKLKSEIEKINYDIDKDVKATRQMLMNSDIVGLGDKYLKVDIGKRTCDSKELKKELKKMRQMQKLANSVKKFL